MPEPLAVEQDGRQGMAPRARSRFACDDPRRIRRASAVDALVRVRPGVGQLLRDGQWPEPRGAATVGAARFG